MLAKNTEESDKKFAIVYIDNGGTLENFKHKNRKLHRAIENETKRRLLVFMRYKSDNDSKYRAIIQKRIQLKLTNSTNPMGFYNALDKVAYTTLKNLNKSALQHSKGQKS